MRSSSERGMRCSRSHRRLPSEMTVPHPNLLTLFAGVFAVLVLASATGWILRLTVAKGQPQCDDRQSHRPHQRVVGHGRRARASRSRSARPASSCCSRSSRSWRLREFVSLSYTRRGDHWALAMVFFFFLPLQYILVGIEWYGLYSILIPVYAFLTLPIFASLSADLTRFFERTSKLQCRADGVRLLHLARAGADDVADSRVTRAATSC